ncbi:hypothetical protein, partial [Nonomuraea sp. NPDC046570]|uniref:hypothetical protein n=1 Tax=Nonomuraea sp. NPDC046570 TaxID=3155255 RepID=UPI0033E11074
MDDIMNDDAPRAAERLSTRSTDRHRPALLFLRHLVEMVIAMIAGMVLFGPVWTVVTSSLGWDALFGRADVGALTMAIDMTLGMSVWMRYRGHHWPAIAEMGAAMVAPILLLLVPFWAGILSGDALLIYGHVLMLPAMVVAMLRRRDEYTRDHRGHAPAPAPTTASGRFAAAMVRRWPTWLALVVTIDNWVEPFVPAPVLMLVLPGAYLVIGAARKQLREPGMLALQLGGFVAYVALVVVAMSVDESLARYLVAAGWLGHAAWDLFHYRANKVVPRAYAEGCTVIDVVVGLTIIFF